jgi:malate synthase
MENLTDAVEIRGVLIRKRLCEEFSCDILTKDALAFLADCQRKFGPSIEEIRRRRALQHQAIDEGATIDFPDGDRATIIRGRDWEIVGAPESFGVELVSPANPKMIVNSAIVSQDESRQTRVRATVIDFEDAYHCDVFKALEGQRALKHRISGHLDWQDPVTGRVYAYDAIPQRQEAAIKVRPNGFGAISVDELQVNGKSIERILLDFGLYCFHNAKMLVGKQQHPFFYIPKLESSYEARIVRELFEHVEDELDLPRGIIKTTIHIETVLSAFDIDSILFELAGGCEEDVEALRKKSPLKFEKSSVVGIGFGWHDYTFDMIRTRRLDPNAVWPQSSDTSLQSHSMDSVWRLIVNTGKRRGIATMGGMAVQLPDGSGKPERATFLSKAREFATGARGVWIAHPSFALAANSAMREDNWRWVENDLGGQTLSMISAHDVLDLPEGVISERSFRENVERIIEYSEGWLRGVGCIHFRGRMEDIATTERSRAELWTWVKHRKTLVEGTPITNKLVLVTLEAVLAEIKEKRARGVATKGAYSASSPKLDLYDEAASILRDVLTRDDFPWTITPLLFCKYRELLEVYFTPPPSA